MCQLARCEREPLQTVWHLLRPGVVGEGQPFAELSYKRHTHQILQWPFQSFPFELSTGKLEIQVYLAEDLVATQLEG